MARKHKRVSRASDTIPAELAPTSLLLEGVGLWCLVAGELVFVPADGGSSVTQWGDPTEYQLLLRYVGSRPERVHETHEAALAYVQSTIDPAERRGH